MKTKIYCRALAFFFVLSSLIATGCTHMIRPPKEAFNGYTGHDKIHLKVAVNLTDELRQTKDESHHMGDKFVIPIGDAIVMDSIGLAQHVFDEAVEINNGQIASNTSVDGMLTPKVAYINRTIGATSFGESIIDIKVEWTLTDLKGNTIWADTVNGQSSGSTGWTNPKTILAKALADLMLNSEKAISSAAAIHQFVKHKSP